MIEVNRSVLHKGTGSYQTPFFFLDKYNSLYQAYEAAYLGSTDAAGRVPHRRPMRGAAPTRKQQRRWSHPASDAGVAPSQPRQCFPDEQPHKLDMSYYTCQEKKKEFDMN